MASLGALTDTFAGEIIRPDDPGYDEARAVWNGSIDRRPALVVRPSGTDDVITALRFAREHDLVVAVDESPFDARFVGPLAHQRRVGAAAAEEIERVDDQRLARAGLTRDHRHARAQRQEEIGDDAEVLDA